MKLEAPREDQNNKSHSISAPSISLPKGGGAIHGMGEKFASNPVTGTGSMSIPIVASPGRGFAPQLSLSYDSGAGNGPFGLGWNLSLPAVTRKTDKGLPKYQNIHESQNIDESDIFLLSGAEDLVPTLADKGDGHWQRTKLPTRTVGGNVYNIQSYIPRIEGLFASIERWTNQSDVTETFWRSITRDNITTWYGKTAESRIADPADLSRIFTWLICESYDDKGNLIAYQYAAENSDGINLSQAHERNRSLSSRTANRYLKYINYGNIKPYLPILTALNPWPVLPDDKQWMFQVVFDYAEHDNDAPLPKKLINEWQVRNDPFSSYRAGFEVRTYRLCKRVLMFHHFPDELNVGTDCLVRSTNFTYSYENNIADKQNPIFSYLLAATQIGYKRKSDGGYLSKSLPPVEFAYSKAKIDEIIHEIDSESLENLPYGLDGSNYQWLDLDGEGLSGILTEQAGAWFYKRNVSANHQVLDSKTNLPRTIPRFNPIELVASKPNSTLDSRHAQFMDLSGNGQIDLVAVEGPLPGFYERTQDEGWEQFQTFASYPHVDTRSPNLKFIDLTGDGHADILISEDQVFVWHSSLAEAGFEPARRVQKVFDEEHGPRIVFADGVQSIFLADMSGDGLTDLVRFRNGEICYWPNLGYCKFGSKVTMDNAPWFDNPDLFDQRRLRLADIDGSGVTDILYLSGKGVQVYFNQSGNVWSEQRLLASFPILDNLSAIETVDLLGNGTACLVWSSALSGNTRRPMFYIDLMANGKPHLLTHMRNNLGAETHIEYAPSTKFYSDDKFSGKPWVTKLPFPVHCVEKVTTTDKWRKTSFSSTYSYHHGYFDGIEREFRGFGRVEQIDVESYGEFTQGKVASPYITNDKTLYQPPIKTTSWFHTGAFLDRERILNQFEKEYFPHWLEDKNPGKVKILNGFKEHLLPQPNLHTNNLSVDEWREALRACKGMMLRQEVVELAVDAVENFKRKQLPVKLFSTADHNCEIHLVQPKGVNRHAVFVVTKSEAITYQYEMDIQQTEISRLSPDPRIAHTLNLQFDKFANVLQSVAVVYPRIGQFKDDSLSITDINRIKGVQLESHLAYSETRFTEDFGKRPADQNAALDNRRLRLPCETLTYELTGIKPKSLKHFTLSELRAFQLSSVHQAFGTPVQDIAYQQIANNDNPQKRLVEHARTLFFNENLTEPLPFREHGRLGLTYESYKLALTDSLLNAVFTDSEANNKLNQTVDGVFTALEKLRDPKVSGYLSGADLISRFNTLPVHELREQYWVRSGTAGFAADAAQHFYLPERYTDPFAKVTTLEYDGKYDLFVKSSTDAMSNTTLVQQFDYRVLAPQEMRDINDNLSEVYFDILGLPTATVVKGKGSEGDNFAGFTDALANPELTDLTVFFNQADLDETRAREWLGNTTARHIYYFGEVIENGKTFWGKHPACACGIVREKHISQLAQNEQSAIQAAFEYSDGMGSVIVKKVQAEPEKVGQPMRWVANGKTIFNNKGKPVKQYEPYFSSVGHQYEEPLEEGVTPVIYYDAAGRVVRTEMPDGSYSYLEFSPWHVKTFDQNDTVKEPDNAWFAKNSTGTIAQKRAAQLAAEHANTPSLGILDSLGRNVISIAHNRFKNSANVLIDEKYITFTKLDAEGKPLWIRDARNNLVMQYITPPAANNQVSDPTNFVPCYDIAGNLLYQHSMDAGARWMLNDAAGKPMLGWNSRGHIFRNDYDKLHRPTGSFVKGADSVDKNKIIQFEKIIYGDSPESGLADAKKINLRGKPYKHFDTAGVVTSIATNPTTLQDEAFDFKGNILRSTRQLIANYKNTPNWSQMQTLEHETFTSSTQYDALNRPIQLVAPYSNKPNALLNIIQPRYNEAGLLEKLHVWLKQTAELKTLLNPTTSNVNAVTNIDYDAKGQRIKIEYNEAGHSIVTQYNYDKETFRLTRLLTTRPQHIEGNKRTLQDLSYTYDPVGNISEIHDAAQQAVFFDNSKINPSNIYIYDALYRLIQAEGREHATQNNIQRDAKNIGPSIGIPSSNNPEALQGYKQDYEYDPVGNILGMHHTGGGAKSWVRWYQYALDSNQLLATKSPSDLDKLSFYIATPGYSSKYNYDAHGNMISMPHLPVMEWDFKDQLHASQQQVVNDGAGEKTYYVYDGGGERVRKITELQNGNLKDERIYLGGFEVYRKHNGATNAVVLERETLHLMDDKQRIALVETRTLDTANNDSAPQQSIRYQLGNHLGSASLELDELAQVISYEEFHPYGTTAFCAGRSAAEVSLKRYRYTGKERDEETGFSYHSARYYAGWLGRWTSCDPIFLPPNKIPGQQSTTAYSYVRNRPSMLHDPDGQLDNEAVVILDHLQNLADEIPEREFPDLNASSQGTRAHLALESEITTGKAPAGVNIQRIAAELLVDENGVIQGVSKPPGAAKSGWRTIDAALLKKDVFHVQGRGFSNLVGHKASDVIEVAVDFKTGKATMKNVAAMEKLIGAPYLKLQARALGGNLAEASAIALGEGATADASLRTATAPKPIELARPATQPTEPARPTTQPTELARPATQPTAAGSGRAAKAAALTMETAPKVLKFAGQMVIAVGALSEGGRTADLIQEKDPGSIAAGLHGTVVTLLTLPAGVLDDALVAGAIMTSGSPAPMMSSYTGFSGPVQHGVGEAYRDFLKWAYK
ncbi:MAG: SpvB/TcaC N-terminal domain-containing protein [Pseudomonadota bacterium]